jgi:hypothetical protein
MTFMVLFKKLMKLEVCRRKSGRDGGVAEFFFAVVK